MDSAPTRREVPQQQQQQQQQQRVREFHVSGFAEDWRRADRVAVGLRVSSSKESLSEASSSTRQRLQYIEQMLRQHGVPDKAVFVRRGIRQEDDVYHVEAEATVDFSDFEEMDRVCCVLLEKLDGSVWIGTPRYHHSTGCLSKLRCSVFVAAVENAQQKASDLSRLLYQTMGPPLLVREETREWKSEEEGEKVVVEDEGGYKRHGAATTCGPVARASARVSITFKFLDKNR